MKKRIKKILISLPAVLSIPIIIIRTLQPESSILPENILDVLALSCLVSITGLLFLVDNEEMSVKFDKINHRLSDALLFSKGNLTAIRPAKSPSIWTGFKGSMYIVNPPLKMVEASEDSYQSLVESHAERFNDDEFKMGHYVFFEKGDQGRYFPEAIPLFIKFMSDVESLAPALKQKLRISVADISAPGFTFFCGAKHVASEKGLEAVSYAITYINEEPLMYQNGFSNWAFISLNESYNSTLEDYATGLQHRSKSYAWDEFKRKYAS
ncbi:hypothetical protein ACFO4O_00700 [Glaciecola siphonariae]|uniref:Uncharacterized protein n=1 Tax=Glaciecola siphonariae TaxID=521012 RepID=A0ABV9LQ98_9ALTE